MRDHTQNEHDKLLAEYGEALAAYLARGGTLESYHKFLRDRIRELEAERDALRATLRAIVEWLERNRPEVWREGIWDAIRAARKETK